LTLVYDYVIASYLVMMVWMVIEWDYGNSTDRKWMVFEFVIAPLSFAYHCISRTITYWRQ
jgi:hypothetical protein